MQFEYLLKETPHDTNDKLIEHRLLFEEENNDIGFSLGSNENIVSLNVIRTIVVTNRYTLGLYKDSVLAKQFDDPLWVRQKNTASVEEWNFEEVAKCLTTIKVIPDDVGPALVRNDINGAFLLAMQQEDLKEICVTQVG